MGGGYGPASDLFLEVTEPHSLSDLGGASYSRKTGECAWPARCVWGSCPFCGPSQMGKSYSRASSSLRVLWAMIVAPSPNCSWIAWQAGSPLFLLQSPVRLTFQESLNLRNPAVFSHVFEVGNPSLCVEALYNLWPPPYSTADKTQATRISEMTPNQLSLYIYRANHDFSQGPQIIGRQRVEKSRKKKKTQPYHP